MAKAKKNEEPTLNITPLTPEQEAKLLEIAKQQELEKEDESTYEELKEVAEELTQEQVVTNVDYDPPTDTLKVVTSDLASSRLKFVWEEPDYAPPDIGMVHKNNPKGRTEREGVTIKGCQTPLVNTPKVKSEPHEVPHNRKFTTEIKRGRK